MSQDGKTIYYNGEGGIRRRNLETGEDSVIEKVAVRVFEDLSPDGREVVFEDGGAVQIASLDGGEPRELFRSSLWLRAEWTRDGRYIIAQALDTKTGWYAATSDIWRIPVAGRNAAEAGPQHCRNGGIRAAPRQPALRVQRRRGRQDRAVGDGESPAAAERRQGSPGERPQSRIVKRGVRSRRPRRHAAARRTRAAPRSSRRCSAAARRPGCCGWC